MFSKLLKRQKYTRKIQMTENTSKIFEITKISLKLPKCLKYPWTYHMTKINSKPQSGKNIEKYPKMCPNEEKKNLKIFWNNQNTPKVFKITKIVLNL